MKVSLKPSKKSFGEEAVTVDAGLSGSGLAFWPLNEWEQLSYPHAAVNIYPAAKLPSWEQRAVELSNRFETQLVMRRTYSKKSIVKVFIEWPAFFDSTARAQASAKRGDVAKLLFVVGLYAGVCLKLEIPFELVPVNEWIGQVPKEVTHRRIKDRLPETEAKSHCLDATGLGLHLKGFLNND